MKKTVYLTESDLYRIINKSIKRIVNESYNGNKSPEQLANLVCDLLFKLMNDIKEGHQVEYGEIDNIHSIACDLTYAITNSHNPLYDK